MKYFLTLAIFFLLVSDSVYAKDGTLDTSFANAGSNVFDVRLSQDWVHDMVIDSNDKIVLVGYSDKNDTTSRFALARYFSNGILDSSFGFDGIVTTSFTLTSDDVIYAVAIDSNEKIVVVGKSDDDIAVARYNEDGTLDLSFDSDGMLKTDLSSHVDIAYDVAIDANDKIVLVGSTSDASGSDYVLLRYNTDGSLDSSFDGDGNIIADFGTDYDYASRIALQSSGKIVIAGASKTSNDNIDFALARYDINGSIDSSFGTSGKVVKSVKDIDILSDMKLQSDKIIIGGHTSDVGIIDGSNNTLLRYTQDGVLDTTFNSTGVINGTIFSYGGFYIGINNNKITIMNSNAGAMPDEVHIARYLNDGSLDNSFGNNGKVSLDMDVNRIYMSAFVFDTSNNMIIGSSIPHNIKKTTQGNFYNFVKNMDFYLIGILNDGSLKSTFGSDGVVYTNIYSSRDWAHDIVVDIDGEIYVGGTSDGDFAVVKFGNDGFVDINFAQEGVAVYDIDSGTNDDLKALALQSDRKIIAVGYSEYRATGMSDFALQRFYSNGDLDSNFGIDGTVTTDFGSSYDAAYAVALQNDGKIVVVGQSADSGYNDINVIVARYLSDGTLDTTFNGNGWVNTDIDSGSIDGGVDVKVQDNGKIIVAATATKYGDSVFGYTNFALLRYNSDGTLDSSFNSTGKVVTDINSSDDSSVSLLIQRSGKYVLVGKYNDRDGHNDFAMIRYETNGTLDSSFGTNAKVITDLGSNLDEVKDAAVLKNDKIVVVGSSYTSSGDHAIVRYNKDGSVDKTFGDNSKVVLDLNSSNIYDSAVAIAIESDGKILLAGQQGISQDSDFTLTRFNNSEKEINIVPVISYLLR
jgi:uncharacterized delta-60 repeat protein